MSTGGRGLLLDADRIRGRNLHVLRRLLMDERRKADVNGLDDNNVLKSSRGGLDSLEKDGRLPTRTRTLSASGHGHMSQFA
jgi:hypothetical protein